MTGGWGQRLRDRLIREVGRMRTRLLVVNLLVLLVPVAGLEFARLYERQLLGALERDMRNQAVLVREMVEQGFDQGREVSDHEGVMTAAARRTRTRIRLLDAMGEVVADSHRDGPPEGREPRAPRVFPDDLSDIDPRRSRDDGPRWPEVPERGEVRAALAGRPDAATRIRQSDPSVLLFLAEPLREGGVVRGVVYVTRSTQPVLYELYRIRRGLLQVLMVALALTVMLSVGLAWTISRPISRLARAARRIARGEREVEVPLAGSGEIRELAEAFRIMTKRLDDRLRYISEFSADVAHEFKSPLTSIRGAAELLGEGAADDPAARERFLRNIQLDAERMDRLVSRLLELGRIEASKEPMEDVDLAEVVGRVVERTHSAEQPVVSRGEALRLRGRAADLERALLNLVENALRFSPPGEPVTIAVEATPREVAIVVSDRGPGIPEAHRARIFERFFTTDAERSGTGLGLAIVTTVAEAHGGRIELVEGEGAVFRLVLPR
jgi:two-component system, OmpR family, sensor histidine kinase ChvG